MSTRNAVPSNSASSALEQIHNAERDNVQRIQAAEQRAELQIRAAHQKATELKHDVSDVTRRIQTRAHQEVIATAQQEARELIEQARAEANALTQLSDDRVRALADWALAVVLGEDMGRKS